MSARSTANDQAIRLGEIQYVNPVVPVHFKPISGDEDRAADSIYRYGPPTTTVSCGLAREDNVIPFRFADGPPQPHQFGKRDGSVGPAARVEGRGGTEPLLVIKAANNLRGRRNRVVNDGQFSDLLRRFSASQRSERERCGPSTKVELWPHCAAARSDLPIPPARPDPPGHPAQPTRPGGGRSEWRPRRGCVGRPGGSRARAC